MKGEGLAETDPPLSTDTNMTEPLIHLLFPRDALDKRHLWLSSLQDDGCKRDAGHT